MKPHDYQRLDAEVVRRFVEARSNADPDQQRLQLSWSNRAAEAVRIVADHFAQHGIRATAEPIRPEEVSLGHTSEEVDRFLRLVDHPAVRHINGDLYHMLAGETHIGRTILEYGHKMNDLHMVDTNRQALGKGLLDLDAVLMALYALGHNAPTASARPSRWGPAETPTR